MTNPKSIVDEYNERFNGKSPYIVTTYFNEKLDRIKREKVQRLLVENSRERKGRTLDIGCGIGGNISILSSMGFFSVGCDFSINALKQNKSDNLVLADAQNLPFRDNCFETITFTEVFEHLPEQQIVLNEIYRVLKRKGLMIMTTPNGGALYQIVRKHVFKRGYRDPLSPDHFREPTFQELNILLTNASLIAVHYEGTYTTPIHWWSYRRWLDNLFVNNRIIVDFCFVLGKLFPKLSMNHVLIAMKP